MTTEELIIKKKLVTDEKWLRRIAKRLIVNAHGPFSEEGQNSVTTPVTASTDSLGTPRSSLDIDFEHLELNLKRQERAVNIYEQEISYYQGEHGRLEEEIQRIKQETNGLKDRLVEEQQTRRNKDEYDIIAKEILKLPSRDDLEKTIEEVEVEIKKISEQQVQIQKFIEQGAVSTFNCVQDLKAVRRQVEMDLELLKERF